MEKKVISDIAFNQYLNEEKLMGSKCKKCGAVYTPPRSICTECYSAESDMEWIEMNGKGKLLAFTCIHVGPQFMIDEGFDRNNPYCVGVVELEERTKVDARIEGVDTKKPETIQVGMPLTVAFLHRGEGEKMMTFLAFTPG